MTENQIKRKMIEAMCSLEGNNDWEFMLEFYRGQLFVIKNDLVLCPDELQLRQLQGKAQVYDGLIKQAGNARDELERIRKSEKDASDRRQKTTGTPERLPVRN